MRAESLLLPTAVLIGCGLIGLGLYFGLAASSPAPTVGVAPTATALPPRATTGAPTAQGGDRSAAEARQRVEQAARAAIEAEKTTRYVPECWKPAIAANPEPPTSKHFFALAFDAEGRESVRGLNDVRGQSRDDVSRCLQKIPMGIRITPPPGVPVSVEVQVEFP